MDEQQMHDEEMLKRDYKPSKGSKQRLETLLRQKNGPSLDPVPSSGPDVVGEILRQHPNGPMGSTREQIAQSIEDLGF